MGVIYLYHTPEAPPHVWKHPFSASLKTISAWGHTVDAGNPEHCFFPYKISSTDMEALRKLRGMVRGDTLAI